MNKKRKLNELKLRRKFKSYEEKLAAKMIGYRGVVYESEASEIKQDKVMVLRTMVDSLKEEISRFEKDS